jgi:ubiquinone/menaquinone biosynthesis C-methylase UbiE
MKNYYDKTATNYDEKWRTFTDSTVVTMLEVLTKEGVAYESVLDYACGTGTVLKALVETESGVIFYGIDPSEGMRRCAIDKLRNYNVKIFSSLKEVSVDSVDLIVCTNALHHFGDPYSTIKKLVSLLRKDGYLYISDYSKASVLPRYFKWIIRLLDDSHTQSYYQNEARELLVRLPDMKMVAQEKMRLSRLWWGFAFLLQKNR